MSDNSFIHVVGARKGYTLNLEPEELPIVFDPIRF